MDVSLSNQLHIFMIYKRFCDIIAGTSEEEDHIRNDESRKIEYSKMALSQLLNLVESLLHPRMCIIDEISKLMTRLDLTVDYSEFSRFYGFVFFICRENGQKSISVSRAVSAWRLVLAGRFRLLNEWCHFVEKNQRHNISEDTWRQVLSFSRCVHENLEGYDPEGAWPVLIDEFVEHMYRLKGSNNTPNLYCSSGNSEAQPSEDSLPGLKNFPGLKRKSDNEQEMDIDNNFAISDISKRRHIDIAENITTPMENPQLYTTNDTNESMESTKQNSSAFCGSKSPCAVEGCLPKGFAELFSSQSCIQLGPERTVS